MYIGPVPLIFPTHFFNRENFKTDGCFVLVIKTNAGFGDAFQWKKVLVTKTNIWTFRRNSLLQATTDVHSIIIRFFLSQWFLNCFKNYWLILEREKGKGERKKYQFCCSCCSCIHWLILVCALTGDWTHNPGLSGQCSKQLSHPGRAISASCINQVWSTVWYNVSQLLGPGPVW